MVPGPGAITGGAGAGAAATAAASAAGQGSLAVPTQEKFSNSTDPQFGKVLEQIQAKYGSKPEKQREIKKTLGKDDFLKIMITQMQHQDPTNPFKAEQMAQQMAQFASVEQLQNVNQNMNRLIQSNSPMERLAMTNLIGKTVTIDRDRFPHTENQPAPLSFTLPKDAANVKIAIINESGEVALEKDLGAQKAGETNFTWDGKKSNTLPAKGGTYMFRVEAKDEKGTPIQINTQQQARVIGLSFEGQEPAFLVGDNQMQEKISMKNIIKIQDASGAPVAVPGAQAQTQGAPGAGAAAGGAQPAGIQSTGQPQPNFFTFQKGVGSQNVSAAATPQEVRAALAQYQASQQENSAAAKAAPQVAAAAQGAGDEKGFPNGLHDGEEKNETPSVALNPNAVRMESRSPVAQAPGGQSR